MHTLYIEKNLKPNQALENIYRLYPKAHRIECDRYGEIFNRKNQNFRLQKQSPSFILAHKQGQRILPVPQTYTLGKPHNYYFSHILNCLYDCRYCFLQGMYRSAHYVLFLNYSDFMDDLKHVIAKHPQGATFFSGYDGDSLALNYATSFIEHFIPFFESFPNHELELRTKSAAIGPLLKLKPLKNVIVAYSLNPTWVVNRFEHKTARLHQRLKALKQLQDQGWPIGLRFDPVLIFSGWQSHYAPFFDEVFSALDPNKIHSVTLGTFRAPKSIYKNMMNLYPSEPLFYHQMHLHDQGYGYAKDQESQAMEFCSSKILQYLPKEKFFPQMEL